MRKGAIYRIENIATGKTYIGSTIELDKRIDRHFRELRAGIHHSLLMQAEFVEQNFKVTVLAYTSKYKQVEQHLLNGRNWSMSYNVSASSTAGFLIKNHPNREVLQAKATQVLRDNPPGPKYKEENSNWRGGKTFCTCGARINSVTKACISCTDRAGANNSFYGRKHTGETKEAIRKANTGVYRGSQQKSVMIDGIEYKSLSEASKSTGIAISTIHHRIKTKKYASKSNLDH